MWRNQVILQGPKPDNYFNKKDNTFFLALYIKKPYPALCSAGYIKIPRFYLAGNYLKRGSASASKPTISSATFSAWVPNSCSRLSFTQI